MTLANLDKDIKAFLENTRNKLKKCGFSKDSYEKEECQEMMYGEEKWKSGYTAGILRDTIEVSNQDVVDGKLTDISKLNGVLSSLSDQQVALVMITPKALKKNVPNPFSHIMVWIITKDTAHTLQSWENESQYKYWNMTFQKFQSMIDTLSKKKTIDDSYKELFGQLTPLMPTNNSFWSKVSDAEPPKFQFRYVLKQQWNMKSGKSRRGVPYERRTLAELKQLASNRKIKVGVDMKKSDIIAALRNRK